MNKKHVGQASTVVECLRDAHRARRNALTIGECVDMLLDMQQYVAAFCVVQHEVNKLARLKSTDSASLSMASSSTSTSAATTTTITTTSALASSSKGSGRGVRSDCDPKTALNADPDRVALGVDVLLVVKEDWEFMAVLRHLAPLPNFGAVQRCVAGANQHHVGLFGVYSAAIVQPPSEDGVQSIVAEAIQFWRPKAVIKIGTGFGVRGSERKIGDVIVSENLIAFDAQEEHVTCTRAASAELLSRFVHGETHTWCAENRPVHRGFVLSGAVNVEDVQFAKKLQRKFPGIVGGVQAGESVARACVDANVKWIVVEGISEMAGAPNISQRKDAAASAASLVKHALSEHKLSSIGCTDRSKLVPATRIIYFSASPLHKNTSKKGEWSKLDWRAEFEELKAKTMAIADQRKAVAFEFYDEGTMEKLVEVLEADKEAPIILVIACHGEKGTGALQFSNKVDGTLAQVIDANKLTEMLEDARKRLELVAFCSCHSSLLAPSIQSEVQVPNFVAFGADEISAGHTTRFLVLLLAEIVIRSGLPPAAAVQTAKKKLRKHADDALKTFVKGIVQLSAEVPK